MTDDLAPSRPHVHFTPPSGWMNDPNGLVHVDGVWHLFYQHHPDSLSWGPMHWGHATSRDLVTWDHRPVAIEPDDLGTAFSGSAVVDTHGVAGFGAGALVAFYTHFKEEEPQSQGIAYSKDQGQMWVTHDGNPVLRAPEGVVDFRDPKVFRWGGEDGHWVMVVVAGDEVVLHRSDDLLSWTECSRFGRDHGAHDGVWETPDLFELDLEGTGERHWVLVVSVLGGAPAGGSGTQYFVGSFDGTEFTCHGPADQVCWVDHGADFYAPQSWYGVPAGRRLWLAWMSNWAYGRVVPASTWRGAMTVPREVTLRRDDAGRAVLAQLPAEEVTRGSSVVLHDQDVTVAPERPWVLPEAPEAYELRLRVRAGEAPWTLEVHRSADGEVATRVSHDPVNGVLTMARDDRGLVGVDPPGAQVVPVPVREGETVVRVLVDTGSVEVFADRGVVVLTNQVFPARTSRGLAVTAHAGEVAVLEVALRDLTRR